MVPMHTFFLVMAVFFALVGSLRGWAKEILVAFSVLVVLFVEHVLTTMVPPIRDLWNALQPMNRCWIQLVFFLAIVITGYASPTMVKRVSEKTEGEGVANFLLGFSLGLLNGLLIVGTLWFYVDAAYHGVPENQRAVQQVVDESGRTVTEVTYQPGAEGFAGIRPPEKDTTAWKMLPYLPPRVITGVPLYLAIGLAFIFVIIVFV